MANLLTREHVRAINQMRSARMVTVASVLITIACSISALALVPSLIIARQESENVRTHIAALSQLLDDGRDQFGETALRDARDQMVLAHAVSERGTRMTDAFAAVLATPDDIALVSFAYTRSDGPTSLLIGGTTNSREALATYVDALRATTLFQSVDVPIATIARNGGDFSVTVRGNF